MAVKFWCQGVYVIKEPSPHLRKENPFQKLPILIKAKV